MQVAPDLRHHPRVALEAVRDLLLSVQVVLGQQRHLRVLLEADLEPLALREPVILPLEDGVTEPVELALREGVADQESLALRVTDVLWLLLGEGVVDPVALEDGVAEKVALSVREDEPDTLPLPLEEGVGE